VFTMTTIPSAQHRQGPEAKRRGPKSMKSISDACTISPAVASERDVVARLMQLYQHDFSEFAHADQSWGDADDDGLFSYIYLDCYWAEERRKPFLFRVSNKLAGFAFINCWSPSGRPVDWCMSEFFVMRKYRRCGLGSHAVNQIIRTHPGIWEIAVASYNLPALAFWRHAVACLASHDVEELPDNDTGWSGPVFRLIPKQQTA
jgi:predicted acetyltransferase